MSPAVAQPLPDVLRVAGIPIDVGASSYYANDGGFFKKHGIDASVSAGTNGAAVAAAVVGGTLDIGIANSTVLAQAHERGLPFVMVAPSGMYRSSDPTAALLVAKNSVIKTARDMMGKVIGVAGLRALGEVAIRTWLEKNGLPSTEVKFTELPYSTMDAALAAGRIDVAIAEEPAVASMVAGESKIIARPYDAIAPQFIEGGFFCTVDYRSTHPDVIRRFADAIAEANAWANLHHDQTLKIIDKYANVPLLPTIERMYYPERLRVVDMQPLIDASAKYGALQKAFPAREMFAAGIG